MVVISQVFRIRPSAIPAAGGCSVSVATITKIAIPTDIAPNIAIINVLDKCNEAIVCEYASVLSMIPTIIPTI